MARPDPEPRPHCLPRTTFGMPGHTLAWGHRAPMVDSCPQFTEEKSEVLDSVSHFLRTHGYRNGTLIEKTKLHAFSSDLSPSCSLPVAVSHSSLSSGPCTDHTQSDPTWPSGTQLIDSWLSGVSGAPEKGWEDGSGCPCQSLHGGLSKLCPQQGFQRLVLGAPPPPSAPSGSASCLLPYSWQAEECLDQVGAQ